MFLKHSFLVLLLLTAACDSTDPADPVRPPGWTDATHGNEAPAAYEVAFAQDQVRRIDIRVTPENWAAMLADMTDLVGEFGEGGSMMQIPPEAIAACDGLTAGDACTINIFGMMIEGQCGAVGGQVACVPEGGVPGMMGMGMGGGLDLVGDPVWVESEVEVDGVIWTHVGLRFKGNSTLATGWQRGSYKLPLKLDFDQFEDDYPEVEDQRFYGFRQLALGSNELDGSYLRDKIVGDLFRESGVPTPWRAFYRVYVDRGDGPVFFGVYTMVEVPDTDMFERQFSGGGGNLYKPEGDAAAWRPGLALDQESFRKKSNRSEADWGDIRAAIEALNANDGGDAAGWRSTLEASLNVDGFVHWLAMNTVLQDWDTYGNLAHNYYLYTDPVDGRIHWIPWDHDLALQSAFGLRPPLSLDLADVGEEWPLIRRIMDDPVYAAQYWTYVEEFDASQFAVSAMAERVRREHDLVAPYVREELPMYTSSTPAVFEASVEQLMSHVEARHVVVTEALTSR